MGSGGVGKSALTIQFINGQFHEKYDPTIEDRYQKVIDYQGVPCFLEVLDTAGQDTFVAMRELYMRNGEGFALIYALNALKSFQDLSSIRKGILKAQGNDVPMILVGNKCDIPENRRTITEEETEALSLEWNCPYIFASARDNINVYKIFENLIQQQWDFSGGPPVADNTKKKRICTLF